MRRALPLVALLVAACNHAHSPLAEPTTKPEERQPAPEKGAAGTGWGTLTGTVVWDGQTIPDPSKLKVEKDKEHCLSKGDLYSEELVIHPKNKGVRWVVVYLISADGKVEDVPVHPELKEVKDTEAVIDQPCCMFQPHVLAMREGQTLVIKNSGAVDHNAKIDGGSKGPNINPLVRAAAGKYEEPGVVARPIPMPVSCSIHSWMRAYICVCKHPYFAVTDANGKFEIKNAPVGKLRLVAWQERVGGVVYEQDQNNWKKGVPIEIKEGVTELPPIKLKLTE